MQQKQQQLKLKAEKKSKKSHSLFGLLFLLLFIFTQNHSVFVSQFIHKVQAYRIFVTELGNKL